MPEPLIDIRAAPRVAAAREARQASKRRGVTSGSAPAGDRRAPASGAGPDVPIGALRESLAFHKKKSRCDLPPHIIAYHRTCIDVIRGKLDELNPGPRQQRARKFASKVANEAFGDAKFSHYGRKWR